jgi:hypothetical protein
MVLETHGNHWKNQELPGVLLWKDGTPVIHTVDFRVLDEPSGESRYSAA